MIGTAVESALSLVGISSERVETWLGKPCNCKERKEKLDQLGHWASRVLRGRTKQAKEFLFRMIDET